MRVARLTAPRKIELFDEPTPELVAGNALLRVKAVGVCGSDLHRFRGVAFGNEDNTGIVLGHEFSAVVEAVGVNVHNVASGDRVAVEAAHHCGECEWCLRGYTNLCPHIKFCGLPGVEGALRDFMVWPAHLLYKLPSSLDFDDGVLAEVFGVALHSVDLVKVRAGMTAIVLGAGPIGLAIVHLLRRTGVQTILASEPVAERRQAALRLGADVVFNPSKEAVLEKMMEATGKRGADLVFEAAGETDTCELSVRVAAPGGKVMMVGIPEDDRCEFAAGPARRKGLTIRFVRRSLMTYDRVLALMEKGVIDARSMITHHFSLENAQKAFETVDAYRDGVIKAIVRI